MTPDMLYTYWHQACHVTLIANTRAPKDGPYRCCVCGGAMRFLWARPVTTDRDRAVWQQARVWNGALKSERRTPRQTCDRCPNLLDPATLIELPGVGKFCSTACADAGSIRHEQLMKRLDDLYVEMPWLKKPATAKEA